MQEEIDLMKCIILRSFECVLCFISARDCHIDVVLVDTAGRMQDNEPLMRALSKVNKNQSL